ncbi:ABC transporter substrate-binding protein [Halomonas denitrificans]|nr:transporter substrate-binding domain-containing protein [Halomonas denitrificans]
MHATRSSSSKRGGILSAALLLLVLTACGSESAPSGTDNDGSAPSPAAERAEGDPAIAAAGNAAAADASAPCVLTVGWDPWEPYHYLAIGGQPQGLDIEIVGAVAEHAGCDLEFLQGGWDTLLRLLRAGELDLMLGATRTPAREDWARFSEPYRSESFRLYVLDRRSEDFADRDLEALLGDGFRLGVTQGYYYGPDINRLIEQPGLENQVLEAPVGELNFTWLLDMQIDGFIEDPFVAAAIERRRRDAEPIVALPDELSEGPVAFMFSRESVDPDVVQRFDAGISALRESGRHQALLDQYLDHGTADSP